MPTAHRWSMPPKKTGLNTGNWTHLLSVFAFCGSCADSLNAPRIGPSGVEIGKPNWAAASFALINVPKCAAQQCGCSSVDRVSASEAEGRGFDPRQPHQN